MNSVDKIRKSVSFLLDDSFRPGVIVQLNGDIYYENEQFKVHFAAKTRQNIDEIIDSSSIHSWTSFTERSANSPHILMEMIQMNVLFNEKHKIDVQLFYLPDINKIIALFDILEPQKIPSLKTYLNAFKQSGSFMLLVDRKGIIRDVNEMHTMFINQTSEELIGEHISKVFSLIDPENAQQLPDYFELAEKQGCVTTIIKYQKSTEDTRFYHIVSYYDKETKMFIVHMSDATEKENLQVQLAHSGSLSAVGQIAASIAHELRNPITTLKGFTQLLKASASDDSVRYISVIEDEIERMESILGEMLVLSKPSRKKKIAFSLDLLIADMVAVIKPKANMEGIEVIEKVELNNVPLIYGDPDKIKQVLLNLYKNALEAMKEGEYYPPF
ncbi:histidine kinase dimerization/phospho-acceptor domain-containing protein [Sporosarcina thermotolerans]|uniref:PAS domain-containing sensor histidine kinase n=1 Tax=Sporosarcina thermotolerans TaxID=633404 RepID=UPI0024BD4BCA|nr:PAS domain-containing sensor histidine kinase [Sporosarcina thermotolerans]WHT46867.1 histidine kinase dimerization/phospho-acceptor domain-containing protein [Sporosarcina thermotolerans]